jgi:hypothetical protein
MNITSLTEGDAAARHALRAVQAEMVARRAT